MLHRLKYALFAGVLLALGPNAVAATPADTLVIAKNIDDIITLDPAEAYELTGIEVVTNIYDRVMRFEPTDINKLAPGVAESYTVSEDGKTITFTIRKGLTFASGNPLSAADAAYSLQRVVKLDKTPAFLITQLGWTKENVDQMVTAPDADTLRIEIIEDFSPSLVLSLMSSVVASVVDMKTVMEHEVDGDMGNGWLKSNSAGSGSFSLKAWKANESVVLEANAAPRGGVPPMKRVVIKHVPEPAGQRLQLEKGDIDIARDLTGDQVAGIAGNNEIVVTTIPQATQHYEIPSVPGCEGAPGDALSRRL
jgi:peptide/nickel transport system substrate-binding protein